MLPARGPRPTLKGESVMTLRLMDDVQIPQITQRAALEPGFHFFSRPRNQAYEPSQYEQATPQLAVSLVTDHAVVQGSYATLTKSAPITIPANASPGMPVFVLTTGMTLPVSGYGYQDGRITYTLASGGSGVISTDDIDWTSTTRLNSQRGVRVTLHGKRTAQGDPGM
jgi:hypothetical protein